MNKKLYVANLPYHATEPELKALFSKAGSVKSVKIVQDRQSGQPRDTAFVEMPMPWEGLLSPCSTAGLHGENPDGKKATVVSKKDGTGIQKH